MFKKNITLPCILIISSISYDLGATTETFDQTGSDVSLSSFSNIYTVGGGTYLRDTLDRIAGAPSGSVSLPVNVGGDKELRYFEDLNINIAATSGFALTNTIYNNVTFDSYIGINGLVGPAYAVGGLVLNASGGSPRSTFKGYVADISVPAGDPTQATLRFIRYENGIGNGINYSGFQPFHVDLMNENYHLYFRVQNEALTASLFRVFVQNGAIIEQAIDLHTSSGVQNTITAYDLAPLIVNPDYVPTNPESQPFIPDPSYEIFSSGFAGMSVFARNGSEVYFDNVSISSAPIPATPLLLFTNLTGVALSSLISSETVTIAGLDAPTPISITGGDYSLNGSTFTSVAGTVNNGDSLQLQTTSSKNDNTTTNIAVAIGSNNSTWNVTTGNLTPEPFNFINQIGVTVNAQITSNTVTITDIATSLSISVTGGEYSINGGAYTTAIGTINNNDTVTLRTMSSTNYSTSTNATLFIGGISETFTVTTVEVDTTPDSFGFIDQTKTEKVTIDFSPPTLPGGSRCENQPFERENYTFTPIKFCGFAINNADGTGNTYLSLLAFTQGSSLTSSNHAPFTIHQLDLAEYSTVFAYPQIKQLTCIKDGAPIYVDIALDGIITDSNDMFETFHLSEQCNNMAEFLFDSTMSIDNIVISKQTNGVVTPNTVVTSNAITVTGINASTPISITGGEYSINGGDYTSIGSFVNNNDTVAVRTISSANFNTAVDVTLSIGGVSDIFTVTTEFDTDGDGVGDSTDAFLANNAASVDANNDGNPDLWNTACDTTCQNNSGLTLDNSSGDGGSTNPLLLGLLSLFVVSRRRRVKL